MGLKVFIKLLRNKKLSHFSFDYLSKNNKKIEDALSICRKRLHIESALKGINPDLKITESKSFQANAEKRSMLVFCVLGIMDK